MKYYFDANSMCKMIVTGVTPSGKIHQEPTGYGANASGDVGVLPIETIYINNLLQTRNSITLVGDTTTTGGKVAFHIAAAPTYYPARTYHTNGTTTEYYNVTSTAVNTVPVSSTYSYGQAVTVATDTRYTLGNSISLAAYNPCGCGCNSCFVSETKVLMADGTTKNIIDVKSGDKVKSLDGVSNVLALYKTILGKHRALLKFEDESLTYSAGHLMWIKVDDYEGFGVNDYNQYLQEKKYFSYLMEDKEYKFVGLTKQEPYIISEEVEYAHVDKWKKQRPIIVAADFETPLYTLITDNDHTFFANGYLVGGMVRDDDYEYIGKKFLK